ncbi:nucleotidyl transferase AbiEii/AbiGii toxin family protein [uncultured Imperialibacter sp.]|uniref:nucleotidyl transferase AbiEii/AbiGii toxin family protein n=1 Tax=Imperialibacter sp. TaxID=2038411 RepID=UPI0030DD5969|tara:strand:+ start:402 stop:1148 length:747 start_codon:yes stop_codon:yes gene_type:complete
MLLRAVPENTERVLSKLQTYKELDQYYLVGGTALALLTNHRLSEDIDLFYYNQYPGEKLPLPRINAILEKIKGDFSDVEYMFREGDTFVQLRVDGVKVDFFSENNFHRSKNYTDLGSIRLPDKKSLAGMKLIAVTLRTASRDLYDLYSLRQEFNEIDFFDGFTSIISSKYCGSKSQKIKLFKSTVHNKLKNQVWLEKNYDEKSFKELKPKYIISAIDIFNAFENFNLELNFDELLKKRQRSQKKGQSI